MIRRTRNEQRGQGTVEFALLVLPLTLIVFGIIEFGLIFYNVSSVRQGVREAGRQASVANFGTSDPTCVSNGASDNVKKLMCLTRTKLGVPETTKLKVSFLNKDMAPIPNTSCAKTLGGSETQCWSVGNSIAICAVYPVASLTGLLPLGNRIVTAASVFRIEVSSGAAEWGGEEQLDTSKGQSWAKC